MKWMRDTDGNRTMSSIVSTSGRSTRPWISRRCCVRIDLWSSGVIALEEQPVRRDDSGRFCSGEKLTEDSWLPGQPGHIAPDDAAFELGRLAVGAVDDADTQRQRPRRFRRGRGQLGCTRTCAAGQCRGGKTKLQEGSPAIAMSVGRALQPGRMTPESRQHPTLPYGSTLMARRGSTPFFADHAACGAGAALFVRQAMLRLEMPLIQDQRLFVATCAARRAGLECDLSTNPKLVNPK